MVFKNDKKLPAKVALEHSKLHARLFWWSAEDCVIINLTRIDFE